MSFLDHFYMEMACLEWILYVHLYYLCWFGRMTVNHGDFIVAYAKTL